MFNSIGQCRLCKKEYTSMHVEYKPGEVIYVCPACMEKTKENFVWLCTNCGKAYMRPKDDIITRLEGCGFENASSLRDGRQLILGIDMCIECNPQGIVDYVCRHEQEEPDMAISIV